MHYESLGTIVPVEVQRSPVPAATQATIVSLPNRTVGDIGALQRADAGYGEVLGFWERQTFPNREERRRLSKSALVLLRQWDRLHEQNGVVYRRVLRPDRGEEVLQMLLPQALRNEVLTMVHQKHGHQGIERTTELLRQRCYWPGMSSDVIRWCQDCERCQVAKDAQPVAHSFMGHLLASRPNEILAINFLRYWKYRGQE